MTEKNQIYKCNICGNIIEVTHSGAGQLVCCGMPMELQEEKNTDQGLEKHVPVIEKDGNKIKVKVGSIAHPMEVNYYIEWIELLADGKIYRKHLNPGNNPEAEFCLEAKEVSAREYCSVHGLWKS